MEKDNLEQFIVQHRAAFDMAVPKNELWDNIEQSLDESKQDNLEQYIGEQREAFDVVVPNKDIWANIAASLEVADQGDVEGFIERERAAFDMAVPSPKIWANVERDLELSEKDTLEAFITQERKDFDVAIPSLKVWANINKDLSQRKAKRVTLWKSLRIAAAIVLLLVAGGIGGSYLSQSPENEPLVAAAEETPFEILEKVFPEFVELEQTFNQELDNRIQKLASYQHDNLVREDLAQVDEVMDELKRELLRAPKGSEQQILDNLIETYKIKLAILERVLERVQTNKPIKTSNNEVSI